MLGGPLRILLIAVDDTGTAHLTALCCQAKARIIPTAGACTMIIPSSWRHVVSALLLLVGATSSHAEPFRIVVTEQTTPLLPNSVIELADTLGYFRRAGVDVSLVRVEQTPMAIAAMTSGGGDMADVSVEAAVKLAARGHPEFRGVASANTRFPYLIAARNTVRSLEDLPGLSFGVGRIGSLDHSLTMEVLRVRGIDPSTLKLVSIGQPALRLVALAAGRVEATTVSVGTWSALPSKKGLHVLVSEREFVSAVPLVGKIIMVPNKILDTRRSEVIAVVTALIQASRDFASDPSLWIAAISRSRPDVSKMELKRLARSLQGYWSLNGGLNRNDLAFTSDWLYRTPGFAGLPRVPIEAWIDFSVTDAALATLGIDDRSDPPAR